MSAQVATEKASQLVSRLLFAETFFRRAKRRRNCLKPVFHVGWTGPMEFQATLG
jgi:hypothetical protein